MISYTVVKVSFKSFWVKINIIEKYNELLEAIIKSLMFSGPYYQGG